MHNISKQFRSLPKPTVIDLTITMAGLIIFGLSIAFSLDPNATGSKKLIIEGNGKTFEYSMTENLSVTVLGPIGETRIQIQDGSAQFTDSPCKDKLCIHANPLSSNGAWSACLPNRVIARVESRNTTDENLPDAVAF